ncbi:Crp/Fnr family transcriptional regulator [Polaribacter sp. Hel1_33_49]|jgi:CRP-like cAMP-binding protein|uniref:Crp/Fnr family transcriptional regulator n=1 Tax=Polaribacter sp. Hel1_33_49 TaxID=1336803 RepID=UPI00052C0E53|nr:Crp/Fnr family transcriptional regulator [Polaribacter sp. Hel1_33_49]KGL61257.1 cAMP-binding protein [Polaribacter sp. Hel1_33_49]
MNELGKILDIETAPNLKRFKKGEFIQQPKQLKANAIYIKKGLTRSYIIDSTGKEHIYMFASEGWITGDIEAVEFNEPTTLYIDCLENSEVIVLKKDYPKEADLSKDKLLQNMKKMSRNLGKMQRRILMLIGSPAVDRYNYFLETYPELPNRVPQKMIASYLGIMPQTLSTIRSKIAKGK